MLEEKMDTRLTYFTICLDLAWREITKCTNCFTQGNMVKTSFFVSFAFLLYKVCTVGHITQFYIVEPMSSCPEFFTFPEMCCVPSLLLAFAHTVWTNISLLTVTSYLFRLLCFQDSVQMSLWDFSSLYSFLQQITIN